MLGKILLCPFQPLFGADTFAMTGGIFVASVPVRNCSWYCVKVLFLHGSWCFLLRCSVHFGGCCLLRLFPVPCLRVKPVKATKVPIPSNFIRFPLSHLISSSSPSSCSKPTIISFAEKRFFVPVTWQCSQCLPDLVGTRPGGRVLVFLLYWACSFPAFRIRPLWCVFSYYSFLVCCIQGGNLLSVCYKYPFL